MNKMMAVIASLSNETVDGQMSKNHKRYTTGVKTKRSTLSVSADRSVPSSSSDDPDFSVGQSRSGPLRYRQPSWYDMYRGGRRRGL